MGFLYPLKGQHLWSPQYHVSRVPWSARLDGVHGTLRLLGGLS